MKIIELTGISGSGKSTLLPVVQQYFQHRGYRVFNPADIAGKALAGRFISKSLRDYLFGLRFLLPGTVFTRLYRRSRMRHDHQFKYIQENIPLVEYIIHQTSTRPIPETHKNLLIQRFLFLAGIHQIAIDSLDADSVLIFEEGYVHKAVSFFISAEEKKIPFDEVDVYLGLIPRIDLVLTVHADPFLCKNRLRKRNPPLRLRGRAESDILDYLNRSATLIDHITKVRMKNNLDIIPLENNDPLFAQQNILTQLHKNYPVF